MDIQQVFFINLKCLPSGSVYVHGDSCVHQSFYRFSSEIMPYTPEGDTTKPQIVSTSVSNITRNGYDVNVVATDNVGLKEIWIGTWNDVIGIDAAKWQVAVPNSNGAASFGINISEFDNVQNTTYHTNAVAYDNAGNQSEIVRVCDPYINGILTSVWMTPQTNYSINAGDSITLSFGADQPVDWYKHIIDMNTSVDAGGLVSASSTGGSTSITFNTPGYYKVFMGAWHVSGDMYTDPIYVSVLSSIEIGGSKNFSLIDICWKLTKEPRQILIRLLKIGNCKLFTTQ